MWTRRKFLRRAGQSALAVAGAATAAVGYGLYEAAHVRVDRRVVPVPNLPPAFAGVTVGVLADLHYGPWVSLDFVRAVVRQANALEPDLFALVGDYGHRGTHAAEEIPPCLGELSALRAPLGVFAVPGNHDMGQGGKVYREAVASTSLTDLTNRNEPVSRGADKLWLAGVDDLWWGKPDQTAALRGVPDGAAVVLLSHNPDFAELKPNPRVGLVLSGHMHGGQVYLGESGTRWLPSRYGAKYLRGLVAGPASAVFVSRGLGEAGVPLRVNAPPEINVLTLVPA